jgi:hypothetical protein
MNEKDHNFQDLKRLLKLKRHEVPPPGYFNNFSRNVISGIRAAETAQNQSLFENLKDRAPWLFDFLHLFEVRPGLIGGAATSLCLLLVFGVVLSDQTDSSPGNIMSANAQPSQFFASSTPAASTGSLTDPLSSSGITLSTNPVTSLQPVATLFGQPSTSLFQPAGFQQSGQ